MNDFIPDDFSGRAAGHVTADDKFDRFVETCQFATRAIYVNRGYQLQYPLIALANDNDVIFLPSRPGPLENLLRWVGDEARDRGTTCFFVAVPTLVGWYHENTLEAVAAIDIDVREEDYKGMLSPGTYWHAGAKTSFGYRRRAGVARFLDTDLSTFQDAPDGQPATMFDKVLA